MRRTWGAPRWNKGSVLFQAFRLVPVHFIEEVCRSIVLVHRIFGLPIWLFLFGDGPFGPVLSNNSSESQVPFLKGIVVPPWRPTPHRKRELRPHEPSLRTPGIFHGGSGQMGEIRHLPCSHCARTLDPVLSKNTNEPKSLIRVLNSLLRLKNSLLSFSAQRPNCPRIQDAFSDLRPAKWPEIAKIPCIFPVKQGIRRRGVRSRLRPPPYSLLNFSLE